MVIQQIAIWPWSFQKIQFSRFKCSVCKFETDLSDHFAIHLKVQHPDHPDTGSFLATRTKAKPTQCQFCHKEFVKPILLAKHVKWKHAKEAAKAEAKKKVASAIKGGKVSKTQSKKFSCDVCDKSFKTTKDVYSHKVKVHHLDRSVQLESEGDEGEPVFRALLP